MYYMYQYMNYELIVHPRMPEKLGMNAILFINTIPESSYLNGYSYAKLDNNEYVFCKGEEYIRFLKESELEIKEYGLVKNANQ